MTRDLFVMINGQEVHSDNAVISIFDLGLTRGYGAFELLRTYGEKPFKLEKHIKRLNYSAQVLEIPFKISAEDIEKSVHFLLQKRSGKESVIRLVLTGGLSSQRLMPEDNPTLIIAVYSVEEMTPEVYRSGFKIMTTDTLRSLPEIKSTYYALAILAMKKAHREGFDDIVYYLPDGRVTESSTSNLFFIKDQTLYTPKEHLMKGITRDAIIELVSPFMQVKECDIHRDQLREFDEAFLTSSVKEIIPIAQIDGITYRSCDQKSQTRQIMKAYRDLVYHGLSSMGLSDDHIASRRLSESPSLTL
ncbi:MAG: aminotransferase class IV [Simkaniaceae bacterium]|nr:aminotransferase class IV [Simkaniaceae bacterium]